MKINKTQLLTIFDRTIPVVTDEELGVYWFEKKRDDGLIITLSFSVYENYAGILIHNSQDIAIANVHMEDCSEIRVLDEKKECLEIVHENGNGRCFMALSHDNILEYSE